MNNYKKAKALEACTELLQFLGGKAEQAYSSYQENGVIYLSNKLGPDIKAQVIAHEWAHWIEASADEIERRHSVSKSSDFEIDNEMKLVDHGPVYMYTHEFWKEPYARMREVRCWALEIMVLRAYWPEEIPESWIYGMVEENSKLYSWLPDRSFGYGQYNIQKKVEKDIHKYIKIIDLQQCIDIFNARAQWLMDKHNGKNYPCPPSPDFFPAIKPEYVVDI